MQSGGCTVSVALAVTVSAARGRASVKKITEAVIMFFMLLFIP